MQAFDEESHRRIRRHRHMRAGKGFETIERYTELDELLIPKDCVVLLECMSNLVANEMFQEGGFHPEVAEKDHRRSEKSSFPGKACGDRHQRDLFRRDPLRRKNQNSTKKNWDRSTRSWQRWQKRLWKSYTGSLYGIKEERKHEKLMEQF